MIRLICTNCQAELQIDDAFAGGVCRCQHCGTIQTVPTHASAAAGGARTKTLYQRKARSETAGSGLDDLADIVASSGLSGSGLSSNRLRKGSPQAPKKPETKTIAGVPMPIALVGGGVILLLLILVIWLTVRDSGTPTQAGASGSPGAIADKTDASPKEKAPAFLGVKLDAPSVVYVLDRGSATREYFSALKEAALISLASLGPERKFQVIFWSIEDAPPAAYPSNDLTLASEGSIDSCRREIQDDIYATGSSNAGPALKAAFAKNPSVVIVATGKGPQLDEEFVKLVNDARGSATSKVHTFALGGSGTSTALKDVARQTGGEYREVTEGELRAAVR